MEDLNVRKFKILAHGGSGAQYPTLVANGEGNREACITQVKIVANTLGNGGIARAFLPLGIEPWAACRNENGKLILI